MAGEQHDPILVSRFEADLLYILQFLLRRDPSGHALELIYREVEAPPCLSRRCVTLIQDTLVKGCVSILARTAWGKERHLQGGKVVEGRLWARHSPATLAPRFSEHTLRFLIWLTAANPADKAPTWPVIPLEQLTVADQLFFYFALGALRDTEKGAFFSGKDLFTSNGLCRLAYPETLTRDQAVDFSPWLTGTGAALLEALQPELIQRWLQVERGKAQIGDWQRMQELGRSQERVLVSFLEATAQAGRRDLARFLLPALQALLPENPRLEWWIGGLRSAGPRMLDRTETNQAALVLPRILARLQGWETEARAVGYFEEEYAASQLWKSDWERWHGNTLVERAQSLLRQIEPLRR
jgi:hypothetical protein